MNYQVLAQKYRPQSFEDVVGQEAVTRTIRNSVVQGRVANAYIFCGPRGVGKTTIARLLAKTLNCDAAPDKRPCDGCASCREISQGTSMDVLEIDGASNRGIDEIRALRENVKFSPSKGRYRIYIIDEVHMLTAEAFNALLKTLEEPPAHVKFIFATTESHKVLPTILSRCQRFDFTRIPPGKIFERLREIAKKEKIELDEEAALVIARSSDGSLRDALVILDQMISFSGKKVSAESVSELLGMVQKDRIFALAGAVISADARRAAVMADELISGGKDPVFVVNTLIGHFRDIMILKTAGAPTSDMALSVDELESLKAQAEALSMEEVLYVLQNLSHSLTLMKGAMFARAPMEIALIRLAMRKQALSLPDVLAKIGSSAQPVAGAPGTAGKEAPETHGHVKHHEHARRERPLSHPKAAALPVETDDDQDETEAAMPQESFVSSGKVHWNAVLNYVREKKMSVFTFLNAGRPVEFTGQKVVIGFGKEHALNRDFLDAGDNRLVVEEAVGKVTGSSPKVEFAVLDVLSGVSKDAASGLPAKRAREREELNPAIENVMDVFGGQIVRDLNEDVS